MRIQPSLFVLFFIGAIVAVANAADPGKKVKSDLIETQISLFDFELDIILLIK